MASRFFSAIPKAIFYVTLAFLSVTLLCVTCVAPFIDFAYKTPLANDGIAFFLAGIALGAASLALFMGLKRTKLFEFLDRPYVFAIFSIAICILLMIIEMVIVTGA